MPTLRNKTWKRELHSILVLKGSALSRSMGDLVKLAPRTTWNVMALQTPSKL